MRRRLGAGLILLVVALSACGRDARRAAPAETNSVPHPATQGAPNGGHGCADSSALRAFGSEHRLAPEERAAVLQLAVLVERHRVRGETSCVSLALRLKSNVPAPAGKGTPDERCLQALNAISLFARFPAGFLSRDVKRAARRTLRVVMRYEQRGQTLCVIPTARNH